MLREGHLTSGVKKTDDNLRMEADTGAQVRSWCCSPQGSPGDELTLRMASKCLWHIWSPCHLFKWRWVPNITSFVALGSTNCNPTHLIATAHSGFYCLFLLANKMFFFWQSKRSYATSVTIGFLSPFHLELTLFLQCKCPLPLLQENYIVWKNFYFCQHNISFSSLQLEGTICNMNLKNPDQRKRLKWLINQRCRKCICIVYLKKQKNPDCPHQLWFVNK